MSAALEKLGFCGWAVGSGDGDARGGLADEAGESRRDWEGAMRRDGDGDGGVPRGGECEGGVLLTKSERRDGMALRWLRALQEAVASLHRPASPVAKLDFTTISTVLVNTVNESATWIKGWIIWIRWTGMARIVNGCMDSVITTETHKMHCTSFNAAHAL